MTTGNGINRKIINKDLRQSKIIVGAEGIIRKISINTDIIESIEFILKNGVYYISISGIDCRRRKLMIEGNLDFSVIKGIYFIK